MSEPNENDWQRARSAAQKDQRIASILDAAADLLEQHGYEEVTLMMIAEQAGFTRSNLYRYFNTREAIFLALYQQEQQAWLRSLNKSLGATDEYDLSYFVELWVASLQKQPRMLALLARLAGSIEPPVSPSVLKTYQSEQAEQAAALASTLETTVPDLDEGEWRSFLQISQAMVAGLYPRFPDTFAEHLEESLLHYLIGVDALSGGQVGQRMHRRQRNQMTIGEND